MKLRGGHESWTTNSYRLSCGPDANVGPRGCRWDGMGLVGGCGRTGYPSYEWVQLSRRPRLRGASEESRVVVEHLDHWVAPLYSYNASIPLSSEQAQVNTERPVLNAYYKQYVRGGVSV